MADKGSTVASVPDRNSIRKSEKSKVEEPLLNKINARLEFMKFDCFDESPLPANFQYDYMFESYVWRAVFLVAFTLGTRLGGLDVVISTVSTLFPSLILFTLTYFVIPLGAFYLIYTMQPPSLSIYEIRVLLIVISLVFGTLSGVFNSHCVFSEGSPPTYFFPGIVALVMQLAGPSMAANRRALVGSCVGSAVLIAVILSVLEGSFTFFVLLGLILSSVVAAFNLQVMIGGIKRGQIGSTMEMTHAHLVAICLSGYKHLFASRLFGSSYSHETKERTTLSLKAAIM